MLLELAMLDEVRKRWSKEDLEYLRLAATTLLAVLLLPLALMRLVLQPLEVADKTLAKAVP